MLNTLLERLTHFCTNRDTHVEERKLKEGDVIYLVAFPGLSGGDDVVMPPEYVLTALQKVQPKDIFGDDINRELGVERWSLSLLPLTLEKTEMGFAATWKGQITYYNFGISFGNPPITFHDYDDPNAFSWLAKIEGGFYGKACEVDYIIYQVLLFPRELFDIFLPLLLVGVKREFSLDNEGVRMFIHTCERLRLMLVEQNAHTH